MLQLPRRSCSSRVLSTCLQRLHRHVRARSLASHAQQWAPNASSDDFGPLTDIEKIMVNSIKATGPLSFATYMQLCLSHPTHGYYMNPQHAVFGTRGDFTTSPEISQVFGELAAVWLLERWMNSAPTRPFRIIELGPGRGTLMDDMLRVFRQFPASRTKLTNVHLIETSPAMRTLQESKLKHAVHGGSPAIVWHDAVDDIPPSPDTYTMLVAHEFFDALPVHLIEKTSHGWHEVLITLSKNQSVRYTMPTAQPTDSALLGDSGKSASKPQVVSSRWMPVLSPTPTATSTLLGNLSPRFANLAVGSRIEVSDTVVKTARSIADLIAQDRVGGCALVVDYGAEHAAGNSLRAFKEHRIVDIFHRPGECDITANVDFALLKESLGHDITSLGTLRQGEFLKRLGVHLRAASLIQAAPSMERKKAIEQGVSRLVDPLGMGGQYAVLGITSEKKGVQGLWPFVDIEHSNNT
ncbi:S-adenosyl-L-methionine-dependent methyltransferase [Pisolithus croceorrhizus]|nr:S-adenosyl-L-methionine-dependent methyltransferase [Pisolithus croceorrhizus]KAI6129029.1 S-adenosyl-L-methionine-dependent methyltransferase [Pisolithus croceorrhizus]KAI6168106.1 S-adenosyl-L-methionine-dependent methyltransferase [Pisolithus thermaeus]